MEKRVPIKSVFLAIAVLMLGVSVTAAAEFPYPKVEFSADMTMDIGSASNGQLYKIQGRVYSIKNKERREISRLGRTTAIINDRAKDETVTLMPDQKMYIKNQGSKANRDPETMIRDGELKLTKEGTVKVNGQTTTKYKIESTQDGDESFTGYVWFSKHNIPIRFKGTATGEGMHQDVEINYTNVIIAKQDPKLFIIPGDYQPLPTGLGGVGGGASRMTPEQIEQLKEMMKKQRNQ